MNNWPKTYLALNCDNIISKDDFSIVPVRFKDRYKIMRWRNQQLYHLRQNKKLTKKDQDNYFSNVIRNQFAEKKPNQILFSFVEKNLCVGYGGLVHINWIDKNAEISFLMNTFLEKSNFKNYWKIFLSLIENVGFNSIKMHKLFVYSYNLRPKLYEVMKENNYKEEANLIQHSLHNKKFIDVYIHSKII